MSHHHEPNGDEKEPDVDDESVAYWSTVNRRSCCDGFCGAMDCYRCRGSEALDVIFQKEDEEAEERKFARKDYNE